LIFLLLIAFFAPNVVLAVCNLSLDQVPLCNSCSAGETCTADGREYGICTVLPAGTESQSIPGDRTVGAGDKVCFLSDTPDEFILPCVVRSVGADCSHCNPGAICYQDGSEVGRCQESADGSSQTCTTGTITPEGIVNIPEGTRVTSPEVSPPTPPIIPRFSINIPTVTLTDVVVHEEGDIRTYYIPWIADYILGVYKYAVYIATILAATMLMIGGIEWLTSAGNAGRAGKAKTRITDAVIGLGLTAFAYLILLTINPGLIALNSLEIRTVRQEPFPQVERFDRADVAAAADHSGAVPDIPEGGGEGCVSGTRVCSTIEQCRTLCERGQANWPRCNDVTIDPSEVEAIPESPGLVVRNNQRGPEALITKLARAGEIARSMNPNYSIEVVSSYRPLSRQIQIACRKIEEGTESTLGTSAAWPGGSAHGSGRAADVRLLENGRPITSTSYSGQSNSRYEEPAGTLLQIMSRAGFVRYSKEIWHFEISAGSACRCSAGSCPWPPTTCGSCSSGNFTCQ